MATLTCTRSDVLGANVSYPAITLTVDVAGNAAASVTNSVTVSGGGDSNVANNSASDPTAVTARPPPVLGVLVFALPLVGNFAQGQIGATYTITVTNNGPGVTTGTV